MLRVLCGAVRRIVVKFAFKVFSLCMGLWLFTYLRHICYLPNRLSGFLTCFRRMRILVSFSLKKVSRKFSTCYASFQMSYTFEFLFLQIFQCTLRWQLLYHGRDHKSSASLYWFCLRVKQLFPLKQPPSHSSNSAMCFTMAMMVLQNVDWCCFLLYVLSHLNSDGCGRWILILLQILH